MMGPLLAALGSIGSTVGTAASTAGSAIGSGLGAAGSALGTAGSAVGGGMGKGAEMLGQGLTKGGEGLSSLAGKSSGSVVSAPTGLSEAGSSAAGDAATKKAASNTLGNLKGLASSIRGTPPPSGPARQFTQQEAGGVEGGNAYGDLMEYLKSKGV